ncbi:hypothetical protein [Nonomuraea glycinis]|uniref:hypothetical protein n=1 Tax=Nonomuraea glycinis TaxID=2047744 RepID=UPI0033B4869F
MTINQQRTWTIGGITYSTAGPDEIKAKLRNSFDPGQARDRKGRWIETGATVSIWGGGSGTVAKSLGGGRLEVHTTDGRKIAVHRNYLTVTQGAAGKKPSGRPEARPRPLRAGKPSKDVEEFTPDGQDTRVPVSELQPGQVALVYGWDQFGGDTRNIGRISSVSEAGPAEDADTKPGTGHAVTFVNPETNYHWTMYTPDDALARVVPDAELAQLAEAENNGDEETATRIARDLHERILADDETESDTAAPAPSPAVEVPAVDTRVRLANDAEGTVVRNREDGALIVQLDSGSRVNANASDVQAIDTPAAGGERGELRSGQWITTPAFNDPVRVEQIQDTLTGAEVEVTTIRGDRRTMAEDELGAWQPTDEPARHRADGAPAAPEARPQEGLFADMGTDRDGNRDIFMTLDDEEDGGGQQELATAALTPEEVQTRVRAAYVDLAAQPGAWVGLSRLRAALSDVPRDQVDEALLALERMPDVNIVPESNQKTLTASARAAAVHIGGQDKHLITVVAPAGQVVSERPEVERDRGEPIFGEDVRAGDLLDIQVTVRAENEEWFNTPGAIRPPAVGDLARVRGVVEGDPKADTFGWWTIRFAADGAQWESLTGGSGQLSPRGLEWQVGDDNEIRRFSRVNTNASAVDVVDEPSPATDDAPSSPDEAEVRDELAPQSGVFSDDFTTRLTDAVAGYRQALASDDERGMLNGWVEFRDLLDAEADNHSFGSSGSAELDRLRQAGTILRDEWDAAHREIIRENRRRTDRILKARADAAKQAESGDLDGALATIDEIAAAYPDGDNWDAARAQVREAWVDPTPLPSTDDGTPPSLEGMSDGQRARLVEAIELMAAGYRWTGDPGRYIAEAHGQHRSKGEAGQVEKDWIDAYIAAHPEVLSFSDKELQRRRAQQERAREARRAEASALSKQAKERYDAGDFGEALALIDRAQEADPLQERWDRIREQIREAQASDDRRDADTPPAPDAAPEAGDASGGGAQEQPQESGPGRRQQVSGLVRQARDAYDRGDLGEASRLVDEAEQFAPGDARLGQIRATIAESQRPAQPDGSAGSPLTYRRNGAGFDVLQDGAPIGVVEKRFRSWYWKVVGDDDYVPVSEATRKAAAEKVAWAIQTRTELADFEARRRARDEARVRELEGDGYARTPGVEVQRGDMVRYLSGPTATVGWSQPVLVDDVRPFGSDGGALIRYVRMDGSVDLVPLSGDRTQVMRNPVRSPDAEQVWGQHLTDTDDSPAAMARRAIPEGHEAADWDSIQPEDVIRVPTRVRDGHVMEWSRPMLVELVKPHRAGGYEIQYEESTGGRYVRHEWQRVKEVSSTLGVLRDEMTPRPGPASQDDLTPQPGVFTPEGEQAVNAAIAALRAELDRLPMSGVYGARDDLLDALDRAQADAPNPGQAAVERQRIQQTAEVLSRAWKRDSRAVIDQQYRDLATSKVQEHIAQAQEAGRGGDTERALMWVSEAEKVHTRWLADTPAPDWEALRREVEQQEEEPQEETGEAGGRQAAPEGKAYADEVRVGDTLQEAVWQAAPVSVGELRDGMPLYANPAGPARLGEPDRASRRVTEIEPAMGGEGVTFVFDDGTRLRRHRTDLVTRGTAAEVVDGGQRVGEWVPHTRAQAGDRVRFEAAGPTLPTGLDREALGIGRFEQVTVEGRVVRRQPGLPSAVLADVVIVRDGGERLPVAGEHRFSLRQRLVLLDDSDPTPPPTEVPGAALAEGDRITGPDEVDVAVERVEPLDDGVVSALVRRDDDSRERHLIVAEQPVRLAAAQSDATVADVEAGSVAPGDWVLIDDVVMQVASDPDLSGGRSRFDVQDEQGRLMEVEMDERVLLTRVTTSTPAAAEPDVDEQGDLPGAEPELVGVEQIPDGTATGRVRLRTDQRRRILDLRLDAGDGDVPDLVRQAAARLRARQEMPAEQMQALAEHLRGMLDDDSLPAARRRAMARAAGWVDAAHARLEGFPPPPHHPGRSTPERTYARNLSMGDIIAVPGDDGTVRFATVTVTRPVRGFGLHTVHLRHEDGNVEQRVLPDGVDLWLMPDLPADAPAAPERFTREHVTADRIGVGDLVRWDGDQFADPVVGEVLRVERRGPVFGEVRQYEMTVRDGDDREHTITVADRGWPAVERFERGSATGDQPYDSVMQPESPEYIDWRDLAVGDRATVSMTTGTITGVTRHPAAGDVPEGVTVAILSDAGERRSVSVFDDPDRPDDVADTSVMRLIRADDHAAARIAETQRQRQRITREREFVGFLADLESSRSRWAATDVAEALRDLPPDADRDTAVAAAMEQLDRIDALDDSAAATLAFRLGARDDVQAAAMADATRAVTGAVKGRATGRIRAALADADLLGGESWPRALSRVAASYRDHPPAPGVLPAGASLARLRDRIEAAPEQPVPALPGMPEDGDLSARLAGYRAVLPSDLAEMGRQPVTRAVFEPTTIDELEAGRVPAVRQVVLWAPDVAEDGGPGQEAMRQLAVLRTAGADVDARFRQHLAGRDVALASELDAVVAERGRAWKTADELDAEIAQVRRGGAEPDPSLAEQRAEAVAAWQVAAAREAELRRMLAETRRAALAATLAEVRQIGGTGLDYTDRAGKPLTGRAGSNAAALRYVEEALPADWLELARAAGPVEVVTGPGQHRHVRADGSTRISLPADDNTAVAPAIREGQPGRVAVPSAQPGGVPKATVAAHELGHHLEATVPGLREAGQALLWDRSSYGEVGDRTRMEPMVGEDRGRAFEIYPGDFPDARTGRVNGDGSQEVLANVLESLVGNGDYADDDLRQWGLGVLALLGTDQTGPGGGQGVGEAGERRDPLDGVNLLALSDEQLRALVGRIDDPEALARLRAELERREQRQRGGGEVDVTSLSDAELESMLLSGWDGYGEDPARTALQDRVIAEAEAREAERGRRGDELGDLAASDLLGMETDDLAALYGRNLGRYGADPAVTALLDQISAELDDRDRRQQTDADPYAGVDVAGMPDEQLGDLAARHEPLYHSDPHSATLVRRVFAEMDSRDAASATAERTPEDARVDELIAQGWDPRDAYAEAHGLDAEEMERQERQALIDAERGAGERREQVVRRMYRQWVYEQMLAAEKATNGYLLSAMGRKAGVNPERLWGGNAVHAAAYAAEELRRWWAEQPNGGRMTYAEWRAQWLGDSRDRRQARERRITSGNGRDFG